MQELDHESCDRSIYQLNFKEQLVLPKHGGTIANLLSKFNAVNRKEISENNALKRFYFSQKAGPNMGPALLIKRVSLTQHQRQQYGHPHG